MQIATNPRVLRKLRISKRESRQITYILLSLVALCFVFLLTFFVYQPANLLLLFSLVLAGGGLLAASYQLYKLPSWITLSSPTAERTLTAKTVASEGKFKALIQHSMDIITILDAKGLIQYQSPSSERMLGYVPDSLIGQSIFELIHVEDHSLMSNALGQKNTFFFSFRMQHHDGNWLYFESTGTNMLTDSVVQGIVLNSRDITDRKREEEQRRQKEMTALKLGLEKEKAEREKQLIEESKNALEGAFTIIEHKNKEITDSINYAFRIQSAILPEAKVIQHYLPNSFVFWRPKDIVSGDFYYFNNRNGHSYFSALDCTGHGVPGAFMTMIGTTLLNQVVSEGVTTPDEILNRLHLNVRRALRQDEPGSTSRDGMDVSFMVVDHAQQIAHWAGANNPLVVIRKGEVIEYKPDKYSIGGLQTEDKRVFTLHSFPMQAGDMYYLYSDGYQDQFGGDRGRKFMTKRFKEFLLQISSNTLEEQTTLLNQEIMAWMGDKFEQVDDILVCGYKV